MAFAPDLTLTNLAEVLNALGSPIRLAIIRRLADGAEHRCGGLVSGVSKSTLTHHWKVLLAAGVIAQRPAGRENLLSLRRDELNAVFPGLLDSILSEVLAESRDKNRTALQELTDISDSMHSPLTLPVVASE
ncbi:ArsR/SmtB family transcription factor [Mycetocola saprophilus]|uniref:ArsR/SmtB family transcription factor n=1 Tax=Mycetocola saprophilus TaxID=76636 RepID=UPI00068BF352|nr:helix-turn-helix domain-containing protein [Mycetocola saprophilus]